MNLRNFDASTFNAWFSAYAVGNEKLMALAQRRFRPAFRVAFDAWRATRPETGAGAAGPTYMPQYRQPGVARAAQLDARADAAFAAGTKAGETSDDYVRATIFLASVLFLVGISTHFPLPEVRYGLVGLGAIILLVAVVQIIGLPHPPGYRRAGRQVRARARGRRTAAPRVVSDRLPVAVDARVEASLRRRAPSP